MITSITTVNKYLALNCVTLDADGQMSDPDTVKATIYILEGNGQQTKIDEYSLSKQDEKVGFYGASIDISEFTLGQYIVLFEVLKDGLSVGSVDTFVINTNTGTQVF